MVDTSKINPFFNLYGLEGDNSNEQSLIKGLVAESISQMGIMVKYLPRTLQKEDEIFHEDVLSSFDISYNLPMYIESTEGFEGDGEFLGKFGFSVKDEVDLIVATDRFTEETTMAKPLEGDLIYFPLSKGLFEIKFVEDEKQFYPAGTLPQYKIKCELFTFSSEVFATGEADIDSIVGLDQDTGVDPTADNDIIQTEADEVLDFSESNPFGTV